MGPYKNLHDIRWYGDKIKTTDVNSPAVLDFIQQRKPDLILAQCINEYFGRGLRETSQHGLFLLHDGITPEYKGLYSPFWAVHNLDFAIIGCTLLRVNEEYDGGEIFKQGFVSDLDHCEDHCYIGHKAVAEILPKVESFLIRLERGTASPINRTDRASRSYTYPGCTDLLRQRVRLWRWNAQQAALKNRNLQNAPGGAGKCLRKD
jgi:methionyl-tRNA formyltransferase